MNRRDKGFSMKNLSLALSMFGFIVIGFSIGHLTKPQISLWYNTLNLSTLTPPNYAFSIAWTILYACIGICAWLLWQTKENNHLALLRRLYFAQVLLNWSWTPLFFGQHLVETALLVLLAMDFIVAIILALSYKQFKHIFFLTIPYFAWILFATYLNFYIWKYN